MCDTRPMKDRNTQGHNSPPHIGLPLGGNDEKQSKLREERKNEYLDFLVKKGFTIKPQEMRRPNKSTPPGGGSDIGWLKLGEYEEKRRRLAEERKREYNEMLAQKHQQGLRKRPDAVSQHVNESQQSSPIQAEMQMAAAGAATSQDSHSRRVDEYGGERSMSLTEGPLPGLRDTRSGEVRKREARNREYNDYLQQKKLASRSIGEQQAPRVGNAQQVAPAAQVGHSIGSPQVRKGWGTPVQAYTTYEDILAQKKEEERQYRRYIDDVPDDLPPQQPLRPPQPNIDSELEHLKRVRLEEIDVPMSDPTSELMRQGRQMAEQEEIHRYNMSRDVDLSNAGGATMATAAVSRFRETPSPPPIPRLDPIVYPSADPMRTYLATDDSLPIRTDHVTRRFDDRYAPSFQDNVSRPSPLLQALQMRQNGVRGGDGSFDKTSFMSGASAVGKGAVHGMQHMHTGALYGVSERNVNKVDAAKIYQEELKQQIRQKDLQKRKAKEEEERQNLHAGNQVFDPFGKGGAGAPLRDAQGNVQADLRRKPQDGTGGLHQPPNVKPLTSSSASKLKFSADMKPAFNIAGSVGGKGGTGAQFEESAAAGKDDMARYRNDQYKEELKKQIEEKKRLKEQENERRRRQEEVAERRIQEQQAKMQQEQEADELKAKENEAERRRKNQEIVAAAEVKRLEVEKQKREAKLKDEERQRAQQEKEWASRNVVTQRSVSPVIPALRRNTKTGAAVKAKLSTTSPPFDSQRESTKTVARPTTAERTIIVRQLSAMRQQLEDEQKRVHSALIKDELVGRTTDSDSGAQSSAAGAAVFESALSGKGVTVKRQSAKKGSAKKNKHSDAAMKSTGPTSSDKENDKQRTSVNEPEKEETRSSSAESLRLDQLDSKNRERQMRLQEMQKGKDSENDEAILNSYEQRFEDVRPDSSQSFIYDETLRGSGNVESNRETASDVGGSRQHRSQHA
ncbi:PREDICTED: centrosome and spindle pole associated protein 1-like [Priapulus caudatus]|uniref:Centrosome and spindle pole associated protein 1-like n=1 Tax=Priapulus caudatus TaxID=37621 RepID=A0ABM1DUR3_PRICU|nr:PREDICTED: centrosome and spindle pole associated protein 1-like [Priapulus caudatus]